MQVEARRWQRSAGYVARGASRGPAAEVYLDEEALEQAETDRIAFEAMKREYSLWTTGTVAAATLAVALLCPKVRVARAQPASARAVTHTQGSLVLRKAVMGAGDCAQGMRCV